MNVWRTAEASEVGTSHVAASIPCQDFHIVERVSEYLIVAVADGAGSASRSAEGARVVCTEAVLCLKAACEEALGAGRMEAAVRMAFARAVEQVSQLAEREGFPTREYASTLLVAVAAETFALFGQVGDGAAIYEADDDWNLVHWPEQEMMNLTDFLTSSPLEVTLRVHVLSRRINRFAMMTDGLMLLLLDFRRKRPHNPALTRLFDACSRSPDPASLNEQLRGFLKSAVVNELTDDDKTLVLAVRDVGSET